MPDPITIYDNSRSRKMASKAAIVIVVITHRFRHTLEAIFRAILPSSDSDCTHHVYLLCTSGPCAEVPHIPRVSVLTTPHPMQIGEARVFAAENIRADFLAFLDDDCIPDAAWLACLEACIADKPDTGMFFGPRQEVSRGSIAGLVRVLEAEHSRKRKIQRATLGSVMIATTSEGPTCAGGNMVINCNRVSAAELFDPDFLGCGFEDVDLQLRLIGRGIPVYFVPGLNVRHNDTLSLHELLAKSIRSGRGISISERKHGDRFRRISRWSRRIILLRAFTLNWIWLPTTFVAPPFALLLALPFAGVIWSYRVSQDARSATAWLIVKPVRDLLILISATIANFPARWRKGIGHPPHD